MPYAAKTDVPVTKTKAEIEELLGKYKASRFATYQEAGLAQVMFEIAGRRVRFSLAIKDSATEQVKRARWRCLFLSIKAKLVSVETGVETFEEAFLAHVVLPDNSTVGEHVRPGLKVAYETGAMRPLLEAPRT